MMKFNNSQYKQQNMELWNEVAPRYHKRWASTGKGPFRSTRKLVEMIKIGKGDTVLDIACGTGMVTKEISKKIGSDGYVVGADTSAAAIRIAKRWNGKKPNLDFVNIDAERFSFARKFDAVTCQYALFFFPNSQKALKNMRNSLKRSGRLGITVHGDNTPFYTSILDPVTKFIPDYIPPGSPDLGRFGTRSALRDEVRRAGFSKVAVKEFVFYYSPGKFGDYWRNYTRYVAKPLKEKIDKLEPSERSKLRQAVKEETTKYTKRDGRIVFEWQVLILTAKH